MRQSYDSYWNRLCFEQQLIKLGGIMEKPEFTKRLIFLSFLTATLLAVNPTLTIAKQNLVQVEGAHFTLNASMSQNLKTFIGKRVSVTLDSGNVISGVVKDVGDHFLHLEKLERKEYFDALIRIEDITAFESRFRMIQR
jgi:small nuclear ribonucleoprotein (snRNP)-like protein